MGSAIEVRQLVKRFGDTRAVAGIDLDVEEGEIVAFLGPNGAGKTTTIEILEGYEPATSGSVRVLGQDPASAPLSWREDIGIVLQDSQPVPELSALESLQLQAMYYSTPRHASEVLELVGLSDSAQQRTSQLSGGQLRRLDLAMALIGNPKMVFLDEPTTGFDPSARRESWEMIDALRDLGSTVLLTTHYMDEAEHLADRIVIIAAGSIVAKGTAEELAVQVGARTLIAWTSDPDDPEPPPRLNLQRGGPGKLSFESDDVVQDLRALTGWAKTNSVRLKGLSVGRPTLEDIYLTLTQGS